MNHLNGATGANLGHSMCKRLETVDSMAGRGACPEPGRMLLEVKIQQPVEGRSPQAGAQAAPGTAVRAQASATLSTIFF